MAGYILTRFPFNGAIICALSLYSRPVIYGNVSRSIVHACTFLSLYRLWSVLTVIILSTMERSLGKALRDGACTLWMVSNSVQVFAVFFKFKLFFITLFFANWQYYVALSTQADNLPTAVVVCLCSCFHIVRFYRYITVLIMIIIIFFSTLGT